MTNTIAASWRAIPLTGLPAHLALRSSHSLCLLDGRAFIFGGEVQPRTPVGDELLVFDVDSTTQCSVQTSTATQKHDVRWPKARVGAAMTAHHQSKSLLLWGGRAGKNMEAIAVRSSNVDDENEEDVWRYDVQTKEWSQLHTKTEQEGAFPAARSFHTLCSSSDALYLHAGCPAEGRLGTLHALDLRASTWLALPAAPGPARGGTVLAAIRGVNVNDAPLLARWGGFCGYELGGPLDVYDPSTRVWTSFDVPLEGEDDAQPPKRSVHGFVPFCSRQRSYISLNEKEKEVVALLFMGEGEGAPKELGHDGAGKFLADTYALLRQSGNGEHVYSWLRLHAQPATQSTGTPEPRGWFAYDSQPAADDHSVDVVIHGGLNEKNERLGDAWLLHVGL